MLFGMVVGILCLGFGFFVGFEAKSKRVGQLLDDIRMMVCVDGLPVVDGSLKEHMELQAYNGASKAGRLEVKFYTDGGTDERLN